MKMREKSTKTRLYDKAKKHCKQMKYIPSHRMLLGILLVLLIGQLFVFSGCNRSCYILWSTVSYPKTLLDSLKPQFQIGMVTKNGKIGFKYCAYNLKKFPEIGDTIKLGNYLYDLPSRYYTHWISTDASECGPLVKVKGIYYGLIYKKGTNVVRKICTRDKKFHIRGYHVGDCVDSLLVDIPYFRFFIPIYRIDRNWYAEVSKYNDIVEFVCSSEEDIDKLFDEEYYTNHTKYAPIYQY